MPWWNAAPNSRPASARIRAFAVLMTELTGQNLAQGISDTGAAELAGISAFAKGLAQDLDAVSRA